MSGDDDWWTSSNEAVLVSLVTPTDAGVKTLDTFRPEYTNNIFGEKEQIFGYKGLRINLQYNASDMLPNLKVSYKRKYQPTADEEALDINDVLSDFLPEIAFQKQSDFEARLKSIPDNWTPPGTLVTSFSNKHGDFQVYSGKVTDPAVKQLLNRIQILVLFFVDGGTPIDMEDPDVDRWTIYFLYNKRSLPDQPDKSSYHFAGYSTLYRYNTFLPPTETESKTPTDTPPFSLDGDFDLDTLPCRTRISQFIIIPPFQQKGLGSRLYSIIYQQYLKHEPTIQLTVEDPNEAFDDMRDLADLAFLSQQPEFQALKINTSIEIPEEGKAPNNIVDQAAVEACQKKFKIVPRQFARVLEMYLMSQLPESVRPGLGAPEEDEEDEEEQSGRSSKSKGKGKEKAQPKPTPEDEHTYRLWMMLVKMRLYVHNRDALGQLELKERREELAKVFAGVEFDYARLLIKAEEQSKLAADEGAQEVPAIPSAANGKRKLDEVEQSEGAEAASSKKARVESGSE
ncbi:acyl-CoA N-acyltransferase [Pseudoneurospora amorphoporcata]|uniref:Histone acetyltransferase type B catalytic subunit n=1 Tax=Pseudoneurospora amorphoporcata TaxID=241081 RepID=A0AAN6NNJ2_9PEZI|nr:acyl-CoA N-acyltransferase [Pseudoneurospora amorphoporcata]